MGRSERSIAHRTLHWPRRVDHDAGRGQAGRGGMVRLAAAHEAVALLLDLALMSNIAVCLRSDGVVEFPDESGGVLFFARAVMFALYDIECACWTVEFASNREFANTCFLRAVLKRPQHLLYGIFKEVFRCLLDPCAAMPIIAGIEPVRFIGTGLRRVTKKSKSRECITFAQGVRVAGEWTVCLAARGWYTVRENVDFRSCGLCSWNLRLDKIPKLFEVGGATIPVQRTGTEIFKYDAELPLPRFFSGDHKRTLKEAREALTLLQNSTEATRSNGVLHSEFRTHRTFRYMFQREEAPARSRSRSRSPHD